MFVYLFIYFERELHWKYKSLCSDFKMKILFSLIISLIMYIINHFACCYVTTGGIQALNPELFISGFFVVVFF